MSVFKAVTVCGLELAVISKFNFVAVDRSGEIWAFEFKPEALSRRGEWRMTRYVGESICLGLITPDRLKRGEWLKTLISV